MINSDLRKRSKKKLYELKPFLDEFNQSIETADYINNDPVQFMHVFDTKKDREIAGFYAALMAWGRRDVVCKKTEELLGLMNFKPFEFVECYNLSDTHLFRNFKHRTFKPVDMHEITIALSHIYHKYNDFEAFWKMCHILSLESGRPLMSEFHDQFFLHNNNFSNRTRKHISTPAKNGSCKRLYMYLRWCIRDNSPVDTGIWNFLTPAELKIPLDVHVARQSRKLGLLTRKTNDWKSVLELTRTLKLLDPNDPVKYDYSLFGLGALGLKIPSRFYLNSVNY
ncbi:MAG: TIGR02757 family protein [Balneolaceae bacterium]